MKKKTIYWILRISLLSLIVIFFVIFFRHFENHDIKARAFNFASYKTFEKVPSTVYYDDEYFEESSFEYNPHLATASICLALSGFPSNSGYNYATWPNNAKDFFNKLGYSNFYSNDDGVSKPTNHTLGVYIASKKVKNYTIIAITIRGAGYLSEWASNLTLGLDPDFAVGFKEASSIYISSLTSYIESLNITGDVKIWTAGYSRGGASSNLAMGRIIEGLVNDNNILSSDINLNIEDIYCYTYEAPAGRIIENEEDLIKYKSGNYKAIHNIINPNDFVTMVAPRYYDYYRYGVDYYLPDVINSYDYYEEIETVKNNINTLPNSSVIGEYKIDKFVYRDLFSFGKDTKVNFTLGLYMQDFIDTLSSSMGSISNYVNNYQDTISELILLMFKNNKALDSLIDIGINIGKKILIKDANGILFIDLEHNLKRFMQDFKIILNDALVSSDVDKDIISNILNLVENLGNLVVNFALSPKGINLIYSLFSLDNIRTIAYGHYPELCFSHMKAMDSYYSGKDSIIPNTKYYKLTINGSDFNIYNGNKKVVKVSGGEIDSSLAIDNSLGLYTLYVPNGPKTKIKAINGDLDCIIEEISGIYKNGKLISNVTIKSGDIYLIRSEVDK